MSLLSRMAFNLATFGLEVVLGVAECLERRRGRRSDVVASRDVQGY
jgi:hypothetical protein